MGPLATVFGGLDGMSYLTSDRQASWSSLRRLAMEIDIFLVVCDFLITNESSAIASVGVLLSLFDFPPVSRRAVCFF